MRERLIRERETEGEEEGGGEGDGVCAKTVENTRMCVRVNTMKS